ncbi:MAG: tetratricopeptide repeat protein, partial [Chthoniobacterales bacterium]
VLHDLAWAAYSIGKVDDARGAMERCLKASPEPATADDAKSFLALTSLDTPPAADLKSVVEAKLQKDAQYVPALMAAANLDAQSGAKPTAIERYQQVLQRFPDFGPAQYHLAALYAEDPARFAEAQDLASKARKSRPDDPAVSQLLGQLSFQRKDYSRALQLLQESGRKKPLDATGLYYLGMSFKEKGQAVQAAETLAAALSAGLPAALEAEARQALAETKK